MAGATSPGHSVVSAREGARLPRGSGVERGGERKAVGHNLTPSDWSPEEEDGWRAYLQLESAPDPLKKKKHNFVPPVKWTWGDNHGMSCVLGGCMSF